MDIDIKRSFYVYSVAEFAVEKNAWMLYHYMYMAISLEEVKTSYNQSGEKVIISYYNPEKFKNSCAELTNYVNRRKK